MGLNIILYKVGEPEFVEEFDGDYWYVPREKMPFDSLRYAGDAEFVNAVSFVVHEHDEDRELMRPEDFESALMAVKGNVRLTEVLHRMQEDKCLWFCFSR